ncbi:lipoteichoic acid biosynthesis MFS flippase LtaA [Abyssicoccus albus]|uniref:Putative MFS family arabinose efflux permease n=1 Tax=Abyssicoccus albus TaxID=1817405 RepID=A0A3N5BJ45_9BACL|nr:MFS transporter [Abyssicoccus albus]RPF57633.1 putative MFS family arabinose efflux permease [Abyssicoccus albus]
MRNSSHKHSFWLLLITLFLVEFARGMYVLSYLPSIPAISNNITVAIASIAVTIHFISDAGTNMVIGFVMKRIGAKPVLYVSFILGLIGLVLMVLMPNPVTYIIASILVGIAVCPIWIMVLSNIDERQRGKEMGLVYFAWLMGMLSGMIGMNLFISIHPTRFVILIPICFVIALILLIFSHVHVTYRKSTNIIEQLKEMLFIVNHHKILFPGILLQGLAIGMLIPILPTYAVKDIGLNYVQYTIILIIGGFGCALAMLLMSRLLDKLGHWLTYSVVLIGFLVYALGIYSLSHFTSYIIICIVALIVGLFYGLLLPAWNKFMASSIRDDLKEESWGVFNFLQGLGTMIGPLIGGLITEYTQDVNYAFYVSSLIFIGLMILYCIHFVMTNKFKRS